MRGLQSDISKVTNSGTGELIGFAGALYQLEAELEAVRSDQWDSRTGDETDGGGAVVEVSGGGGGIDCGGS